MVGESTAASSRGAAPCRQGRSRGQTRRPFILAGVLLALTAPCGGALAATSGYGTLIATANGRTASPIKADFHVTSRPRAFTLLVTGSTRTTLTVSWSVSCSNTARGERGGAAGKATVARGRWVKRVGADWIKRPTYCSGVVRGSADHSGVQIRVYAG